MKSRISNKKAGAPIDEFIAFVVFMFVAVFAIFLLNVTSRSDENEIRDNIALQKSINDGHNNLMSFLRQQNDQVNMQEIIANSYYRNDYSQITQSITSFFNSKYSNKWAVIISDSNNRNVLIVDPHNVRRTIATPVGVIISNQAAAAYLPLRPENEVIYLKISLMQQGQLT